MKTQDDGTLSLFDDFPPAFDPEKSPPPAAPKKPRAKRKTAEPKVEVADAHTDEVPQAPMTESAVDQGVHVEKTLHLAGLVKPQRRRNSPWAGLDLAAMQANAQVPHVMIVITRGEAGGAQSTNKREKKSLKLI